MAPLDWHCLDTVCKSDDFRPDIAMKIPGPARLLAKAFPIPLDAPVIRIALNFSYGSFYIEILVFWSINSSYILQWHIRKNMLFNTYE